MGIVINKDLLKKIYTDYEKNKGQNKNTNEKAKVKKTKNLDIFKNNLINTKKIDYGNQNEIILENNKENRAKINKIDDEVNKNINNILFRRHKSFDYQLNNKMQNELILSNYPNYNDNNSVEDNKSINSDYSDISSESLLIKRTNIKNENKLKSIKLRNSYYTKLVLSEILTFQKIPKVTNIFIFDWDDTLMCTSFVAPCGVLNIEDMKQNDKLNMKNLDQLVSALLIKSMEKGEVFIITNAAYGWVEFSSKKLYPLTYNILKRIKIISARGMCEKKYPGDYRQWKTQAFIETMKESNINLLKTTNIISFGDSIIELEASHKLKDIFADGYIKTIKFKENPQPAELIKELKIINNQFDIILSNNRNLSIKVAKKKND
jgi:hypothetical protein